MNSLQVFNFEVNTEVRTLVIDNEPWFVGKDIAKALGYTSPTHAIKDHCKVAKSLKYMTLAETATLNSLPGNTLVIPERDVYRLIMRSKLPSAERFGRATFKMVPFDTAGGEQSREIAILNEQQFN